MSSYFTTEIGRMRNDEMVTRGLHYQEINRRNHEKTVEPRRSPRSSGTRVLLFAVLSFLFALALSSVALWS